MMFALLVFTVAWKAASHGLLGDPMPRNLYSRVYGPIPGATVDYCPHCANYGAGQPWTMICGSPGQGNHPEYDDIATRAWPVNATITGDSFTTDVYITLNHGGVMNFRFACMDDRLDEPLISVPQWEYLERAEDDRNDFTFNAEYPYEFFLPGATINWKPMCHGNPRFVKGTQHPLWSYELGEVWKVTSKWKAPTLHKTCEHGVLVWDWETSNTCIPSTFTKRGNQPRMTKDKFGRIFNHFSWPVDVCRPTRSGETFSNCADVRFVVGNDLQPNPRPAPTPVPPAPKPNGYYAPTWRLTDGSYACECTVNISPTDWESEIDCLTAFRRGDMGSKCVDETGPTPLPAPSPRPRPRPRPRPSPRPTRSPTPTPSTLGAEVFLGYYGSVNAMQRTFNPKSIPGEKLTHVCYAYAYIGSPMYSGGMYTVRPSKDNDDESCHTMHKGTYCKLKELKERYPHLKTLISIGGSAFSTPEHQDPANAAEMRSLDPGWSHLIFSDMVKSSQHRRLFITSAINFCREWSFDGIDIAWHFPNQRPDDKYNFALLLDELRRAIDADAIATNRPPLLFTLAVSANLVVANDAYDVSAISEHVDWIHVMTYDMYGHHDIGSGAQMHAQLYGTNREKVVGGADSINWWLGEGMPPKKITYGVVTYARTYKLRSARPKQKPDSPVAGPGRAFDDTQTPGIAAYFEVIKVLQNRKTHSTFDSWHCGAYAQMGTLWMGYDDENSMQCKAEYVAIQHLLGGFVWEVGMDDFTNGSPLISAFSKAVRLRLPMPTPKPLVRQYEPKWRVSGAGHACECLAVARETGYASEVDCFDAFRRGSFGVTCVSGLPPSPTPSTSTTTTTSLRPTTQPNPQPMPSPSPRPHQRHWYAPVWKRGKGGLLCKCKVVQWRSNFAAEEDCVADFQKKHQCTMLEEPLFIDSFDQEMVSSWRYFNMSGTVASEVANVEPTAIFEDPTEFDSSNELSVDGAI